jgi:hypothetical protein
MHLFLKILVTNVNIRTSLWVMFIRSHSVTSSQNRFWFSMEQSHVFLNLCVFSSFNFIYELVLSFENGLFLTWFPPSKCYFIYVSFLITLHVIVSKIFYQDCMYFFPFCLVYACLDTSILVF